MGYEGSDEGDTELLISGRQLTSAAVVEVSRRRNLANQWRRWFRGLVVAELVEGSRHVASIESRFAKTKKIAGVTHVRETSVDIPSGARWTVTTEPDPMSVHRGQAREWKVVVRDDLDRQYATLTGLEKGVLRTLAREAVASPPIQEVTGHLTTAAKKGGGLLQTTRAHRRGSLKWLAIGGLLSWVAFGFLIATLALVATSNRGPALGLGIASLVIGPVGWWALRRWRDPSKCWSCGEPVVGRPRSCPECQASKPSSAGWVQRARDPLESLGSAGGGLTRKATAWMERAAFGAVEIRVKGATHVAVTDDRGCHIDGVVAISKDRHRAVTVVPEISVPLELALLLWHWNEGAVQVPSSSTGGGG